MAILISSNRQLPHTHVLLNSDSASFKTLISRPCKNVSGVLRVGFPCLYARHERPRHEAVNHRLIARGRAAHSAPGRSDKSTSTRAPPQSDIRAVTRSIIQQSAITKPFLGFAASSTLVFLISSASVLTSCRKLRLKTAWLFRSPYGRPNRPRALRDEEAHWESI